VVHMALNVGRQTAARNCDIKKTHLHMHLYVKFTVS